MESGEGFAWSVSKEKLIREIKSTYDAILKFKDCLIKSDAELSALSMEQLSRELQEQTDLLDRLVSKWDIQT